MQRTVLLVTGAGRSGTSTVAGALSLLGAHVPGPHLTANASNPKGFYESQWSVDLHNALLQRANVILTDARPEAQEKVTAKVTAATRAEIREWIEGHTDGHDLTVLKDPRTVWTLDAWHRAAADAGVRLVLVTMLRHPAEVIASRSTHYTSTDPYLGEEGFATRNLAGWVNATLLTESRGRGRPRALLRYEDLLTDWRRAMLGVDEQLDLGLAPQLHEPGPHPVDGFIDPTLSRHRPAWADPAPPAQLREIAESIWSACCALAEQGGRQPEAESRLDAVRADYDAMYRAAQQLTNDTRVAAGVAGRRAGVRAERKRQQDTSPEPAGGLAGLLSRAGRRVPRRGRVR